MSSTGVIALGRRVVVTLLHHGVLCSYRSFISGLFWGLWVGVGFKMEHCRLSCPKSLANSIAL